jgi:hypothetical protein
MECDLDGLREAIGEMHSSLDDIRKRTIINVTEDPKRPKNASSKLDIKSIHFNLGRGTRQQQRQYNNQLVKDLELRGLTINNAESIKLRQKRLKKALLAEWQYIDLKEKLDHGNSTSRDEALFLLMNCPPLYIAYGNAM